MQIIHCFFEFAFWVCQYCNSEMVGIMLLTKFISFLHLHIIYIVTKWIFHECDLNNIIMIPRNYNYASLIKLLVAMKFIYAFESPLCHLKNSLFRENHFWKGIHGALYFIACDISHLVQSGGHHLRPCFQRLI